MTNNLPAHDNLLMEATNITIGLRTLRKALEQLSIQPRQGRELEEALRLTTIAYSSVAAAKQWLQDLGANAGRCLQDVLPRVRKVVACD